jgi:CTP synthase
LTQYVFVTGGVVSSLGKGIVVASIGRMLKSRGATVAVMKLDPYLNVDPGTMSPYQHGEVYVTGDGSETDLDLGHYERFIDLELTATSNVTAGQIYSDVITRERNGRYLGGTIQTVPHVTNLIKERIHEMADESGADVAVIEVGGTVGDIEGLPFLEAIRQMHNDVGRDNATYVHLTLLPYLGSTGELKTKPTQHSVQTLRGIGIQPDAIICRSDYDVDLGLREKISLYCDVATEAVIGLETLDTVYAVPLSLEESGFGTFLSARLGITEKPDLSAWSAMVEKLRDPDRTVRVAIVGKYVELPDSYLSVIEALRHAALAHGCEVKIDWIKAEDIEEHGADQMLNQSSGVIVPGGFGERGVEGMVSAATYARERGIPYLGLCLGMQVMVIEYARSVLGLEDANSAEFDPGSKNHVIAYLPGQEELGETGGTMRLGLYPCKLTAGTISANAYGDEMVNERHRHRYELNNEYRERLNESGLISSGTSPDGSLVEISEVAGHPFMVGSQFHPEFASRPDRPHPLFREFVGAAIETLREGAQHELPLDDSLEGETSSSPEIVARSGIAT